MICIRTLFAVYLILTAAGWAAEAPSLQNVSISKSSFSPTLGQTVQISFELGRSGAVTAQVLDRDGYLVRTLSSGENLIAGSHELEWNGLNNSGEIVPDEAYSFKIYFTANGKTETYFPANLIAKEVPAELSYYNRQEGLIHYSLPAAARVHIQAGSAKSNPKTKEIEGPVLKTVVNRAPKPTGSVVESWNGYDQSGSIYVPDLPNFTIVIAATALPENSVITFGNRSKTFLESLPDRKHKSLFTFATEAHEHHQGLSALDDISPELILKPKNANFVSTDRLWNLEGTSLKLGGYLEGPTVQSFLKQPGRFIIFVDGKIFKEIKPPAKSFEIDLSLRKFTKDIHTIAVNWGSKYGPVSASALRVRILEPPSKTSAQMESRQ